MKSKIWSICSFTYSMPILAAIFCYYIKGRSQILSRLLHKLFDVSTTAESWARIWPVKYIKVPPRRWVLSILWPWFCCCLLLLPLCVGVLHLVLVLWRSSNCPFLWWKRELLDLLYCVIAVMWLLVFCVSSQQRLWLDCGMWLWHFLVILTCPFVRLFDLILYIPVNNISITSGRVYPGWTSTELGLMCLAQGHNAVTPVRLEPAALWLESSAPPLSHCAPTCLFISELFFKSYKKKR